MKRKKATKKSILKVLGINEVKIDIRPLDQRAGKRIKENPTIDAVEQLIF